MNYNDYIKALKILRMLPIIREKLAKGDKWQEIKHLCEPLGLSDTAFRDHPRLDDFLVSYDYWIGKLHQSKAGELSQ